MDAKTIFDGKPQSMQELWRAVWHDRRWEAEHEPGELEDPGMEA